MSEYTEQTESESLAPEISPNALVNYFTKLKLLYTTPSLFFRVLEPPFKVVPALIFALITHWLGAALGFFWQAALGKALESRLEEFITLFDQVVTIDQDLRERFMHWVWGVGSVLMDPFVTLGGILFTSVFVWMGARLLVSLDTPQARDRLTFDAAVTVVSYGMAASLLNVIPIVGSIVAPLFTAILTIIGAREVYRVGSGRATVIALFPKILLMVLMLSVFAFFVMAALQLMVSLFT